MAGVGWGLVGLIRGVWVGGLNSVWNNNISLLSIHVYLRGIKLLHRAPDGASWEPMEQTNVIFRLPTNIDGIHGVSYVPLTKYVKSRFTRAPGMFFPPPRGSDPDMHNNTCVQHVPWCMPGSLTSGFLSRPQWGPICPKMGSPCLGWFRCLPSFLRLYRRSDSVSGFLWSRRQGNVPGIPGACTTRNFMYLVRGPWDDYYNIIAGWRYNTWWPRKKWPPFFRRHFQMHFSERKHLNVDIILNEVCSNWQ